MLRAHKGELRRLTVILVALSCCGLGGRLRGLGPGREDGAECDCADNDGSAQQGQGSGHFADKEKHPHWVENWLHGLDQNGFDGGQLFDCDGDEDRGETDLKDAEKEHPHPVGRGGRGSKQKGKPEQRGEEVAEQDGFDGWMYLSVCA